MESTLQILKSEKALEELTERYPDALDLVKKEAILARKLAEDAELWKLDPGSRLKYVKQNAKDADTHYTSAILQIVYDVDMNMDPVKANLLLLENYMLKLSEEMGTIKIEDDGTITPIPISEEEIKEHLSSDDLKKIEEYASKFASMYEEGPDDYFERTSFAPSGIYITIHPKTKEIIDPPTKVFRATCLKKFGKANIPKVELNPYPYVKALVELSTKQELGISSIPDYKIKMSDITAPHSEGNIIALPKSSFSSEQDFLFNFSFELPHIALGHKESVVQEIEKDRFNYFKVVCWQEGIASRVVERCFTEYLFANGWPEYKSKTVAKETVEEMTTAPTPLVLLEYRPDIGIHNTVAHSLGWWFVRKLPIRTFQKMVRDENAYLSEVFPWNGGEINEDDHKKVRGMYASFKERSRKRYGNTKHSETLEQSFKKFEKDFKRVSNLSLV